MYSDKTHNILQ